MIEDFPGVASSQEEFHPGDFFTLRSAPSTASRCKCQPPNFDVKAAITHNSFLFHTANTHTDGGTSAFLPFSAFNRRFQVAIAIDIGNVMLWYKRNILAINGDGKRIGLTESNCCCRFGKEITRTKLRAFRCNGSPANLFCHVAYKGVSVASIDSDD